MTAPLVSVCVPNLNTFPYLRERVDTIFGQTHSNWEMVVSDNFSEDGAWEFFQDLARKDKRVFIAQAPREGLYANWNNCLRRSRGDYVYIATSDDTMAPDCLERLCAALERHSDCDLAHCPLVAIDESGAPLDDDHWPDGVFGSSVPELLNIPHVRRAPYDGLLHLAGEIVYLSMTQLLIRRSLFSRIGGFRANWGSVGDFNWGMKAGLVANTVHVPTTWATWRKHSKQATAAAGLLSVEHERRVEEMIEDAVQTCERYLNSAVVAALRSHRLEWSRDMRIYYAALRRQPNAMLRRLHQAAQLFNGTAAARTQVIGRLLGKHRWTDAAPAEIRLWLESLGLGPVIAPE